MINTLMVVICLILPEGQHAGERRCVVMHSIVSKYANTNSLCDTFKNNLSFLPPDINIIQRFAWTEELNLENGNITYNKSFNLRECDSK